GGMLGHPLQRGREFECLQHHGGDATKGGGTHAADSSSRTIWFTTLPSARPLNLGITCPMTLPTSRTPPAIASRTARRISSGSTAAGRNASSAFTSASSASARSPRPAAAYCSAASRRRLMPRRKDVRRFVVGGRVLELEFAVLEVCEDRGEEEG